MPSRPQQALPEGSSTASPPADSVCCAAQLWNIEAALGSFRLAPVVILMTFTAASLGDLLRGTVFTMTLAAGFNSGEQNVRGIVAFESAAVAGRAGHHPVRAMIKFGMFQPTSRNVRWRDLGWWCSVGGIDEMALATGFRP